MQESVYRLMKNLRKKLKSFLKDKFIIDIFIIGSALKEKFKPNDLDMIILFRSADYGKIEDSIYKIKHSLNIEKIHIEPLIIDDFFKKSISSAILHEGMSIKNNKPVSEALGYNPYSLFIFTLENLDNVKKVRFAQTLYGRKNDGLLIKENGKSLGRGAFIIPISKEELFTEIMKKFNVKYELKKAFINY